MVPTALRGAFQSCGQNCAGAERFIVQEPVYDDFVSRVVAIATQLRQGPALGEGMVDCGAMCMPGLAEKVHGLVQDAVQHGAKVYVFFCVCGVYKGVCGKDVIEPHTIPSPSQQDHPHTTPTTPPPTRCL